MANVIMYSSQLCPFCTRARHLLDSKGVMYQNIDVDADPELRLEMMQKSGQRTVPQIWINDEHVGGFTDMYELETQGVLDDMLKESA